MNIIKELRKDAGLSQDELAQKLNVHQTAISQWEMGKTNPDVSQLKNLANILDTSADVILGIKERPQTRKIEISTKEKELLDLFRIVPDEMKKSLVSLIETTLKSYGQLK